MKDMMGLVIQKGLLVETSMKNFVNDLADIGGRLTGNTCLFGNIDPYGVLEKSRGAKFACLGYIYRRLFRTLIQSG